MTANELRNFARIGATARLAEIEAEVQAIHAAFPEVYDSVGGMDMLTHALYGVRERVRSSVNEPFLVFRPSLPQLIPNLPRNAQVIYPKDLGPILIWADLFPGARVVEAGVGAGALSMTLLRAIGSSGQLITYEIREDFADMARKTVSKYFGPTPNWILKVGDIESELEETDVHAGFPVDPGPQGGNQPMPQNPADETPAQR